MEAKARRPQRSAEEIDQIRVARGLPSKLAKRGVMPPKRWRCRCETHCMYCGDRLDGGKE